MTITDRQWIESLQYQVDKILKHHGVDAAGDLAAAPQPDPCPDDGLVERREALERRVNQYHSRQTQLRTKAFDRITKAEGRIEKLQKRTDTMYAYHLEQRERIDAHDAALDGVYDRFKDVTSMVGERFNVHKAALADLDKRLVVEREASFGAWNSLTDTVLAHDAALAEVRGSLDAFHERISDLETHTHDTHDTELAELRHLHDALRDEFDRADELLGTHRHLPDGAVVFDFEDEYPTLSEAAPDPFTTFDPVQEDAKARDAARLPEVLARRVRDFERLVIAEADTVPDAGDDDAERAKAFANCLGPKWDELHPMLQADYIQAMKCAASLTPTSLPLVVTDELIQECGGVFSKARGVPGWSTYGLRKVLEYVAYHHWNATHVPVGEDDRSGT